MWIFHILVVEPFLFLERKQKPSGYGTFHAVDGELNRRKQIKIAWDNLINHLCGKWVEEKLQNLQ